MRTIGVIKKLLNLAKSVIENVYFETKNGREIFVTRVRPTKRERNRCPICGKKCPGYDKIGIRRWRTLDFGSTETYIEAESVRVNCPKHGVIVARVPWARHNSNFTRDFEQAVTWFALHATITDVSEYFRIKWDTVEAITKRVGQDLEILKPNKFDNLEEIGIDETSYKKGHKYMTVVVNHKTGALIWAKKGHGKEVLTSFFEELTPEQRAKIRLVSADGARWIADCVAEFCPNAERCVDPFHVVSWATKALDDVRKNVIKEATKDTIKGVKARGGKKKQPKCNLKYSLLKNPENLTENQRATLEMLTKSAPKLYRAYLLKENLRLCFYHAFPDSASELEAWLKWACRCRIPEFVELGRKIKRHKQAIINSFQYRLTNARIEAINNKIKVTIRMGYGFRNIDNLISLVKLKCSDMKVNLPGR